MSFSKPLMAIALVFLASCLDSKKTTKNSSAPAPQSYTEEDKTTEGGCSGFEEGVCLDGNSNSRDITYIENEADEGESTSCATDVKLCDDGVTTVARDPEDNCRFKNCPNDIACTMDAKVCPDGSSVGRDSANNCQFFPCPTPTPTATATPSATPTPGATPTPTSGGTPESSDFDHPYAVGKWSKSSFPIQLKVSKKFTSNEAGVMKDMGDLWERGAQLMADFFKWQSSQVENKRPSVYSSYLYDDEMGIYMLEKWYDILGDDSIAVTLFRGTWQAGYILIEHADILFNNDDFKFGIHGIGSRLTLSYKYDIGTVALHELGHFVGLTHVPKADDDDSIMNPSIKKGKRERELSKLDKENIYDLYDTRSRYLDQRSAMNVVSSRSGKVKMGQVLEGFIRLKKDGECEHVIGEKVIFRHTSSLK